MDSTITLVGNLSQDPELKFLNGGTAVTKISIAVNRVWNDKQGNKQEQVSFFNGDCFGTLAENVANSLKKGDRVIVTGRLEQRTWETDKGEKRSTVEVKVDSLGAELRFSSAQLSKVAKPQNSAPVSDEPF